MAPDLFHTEDGKWTDQGSVCKVSDLAQELCQFGLNFQALNTRGQEFSRVIRLEIVGPNEVHRSHQKSWTKSRRVSKKLKRVSGGTLDTEGLEQDDLDFFLRYMEDGTVELHKWVTQRNARWRKKTCRNGRRKCSAKSGFKFWMTMKLVMSSRKASGGGAPTSSDMLLTKPKGKKRDHFHQVL